MKQLIIHYSDFFHNTDNIREIPTQPDNEKTVSEIKSENRKTIAEVKELEYDSKKKVKPSIHMTDLNIYTLYNY